MPAHRNRGDAIRVIGIDQHDRGIGRDGEQVTPEGGGRVPGGQGDPDRLVVIVEHGEGRALAGGNGQQGRSPGSVEVARAGGEPGLEAHRVPPEELDHPEAIVDREEGPIRPHRHVAHSGRELGAWPGSEQVECHHFVFAAQGVDHAQVEVGTDWPPEGGERCGGPPPPLLQLRQPVQLGRAPSRGQPQETRRRRRGGGGETTVGLGTGPACEDERYRRGQEGAGLHGVKVAGRGGLWERAGGP